MKFRVVIIEETERGVGKGATGTFVIADDHTGSLTQAHMLRACETEMIGLFNEMIKELYGYSDYSEKDFIS